jgi:hypothetical protein
MMMTMLHTPVLSSGTVITCNVHVMWGSALGLPFLFGALALALVAELWIMLSIWFMIPVVFFLAWTMLLLWPERWDNTMTEKTI